MHLDIYYGSRRHTNDVIVSVIAFLRRCGNDDVTVSVVYAIQEYVDYLTKFILHVPHVRAFILLIVFRFIRIKAEIGS